ncbi:hypothetical protein ASZ90_010029 [hydrocarbon metagenome]|uniref:Uncharacterized protein n=1 Tax=hydrocarbon metagenome TaxID=938273 RepID=A0A0W8FH84_9ZZZZ
MGSRVREQKESIGESPLFTDAGLMSTGPPANRSYIRMHIRTKPNAGL